MDQEPNDWNQKIGSEQVRIRGSLAKNQLAYQMNGFITIVEASPAAKFLADYSRQVTFLLSKQR